MEPHLRRVSVAKKLGKIKGIYGIERFTDLELKNYLNNPGLESKCKIQIDLYNRGWNFIKYDPKPRNAEPDVLNLLKEEAVIDVADYFQSKVEHLIEDAYVTNLSESAEISLKMKSGEEVEVTIFIEDEGFLDRDLMEYGFGKINVVLNSSKGIKEFSLNTEVDDFTEVVDYIGGFNE